MPNPNSSTPLENLLIVDDDPVQRRLLRGQLEREGYALTEAETGEIALQRLAETGESAIDLVILDVMMPGMDGLEVQNRMSAGGHNQPVILQTAKGSIDTAIAAMRNGAFDFLIKPVRPERLQEAVRKALQLRQTRAPAPREERTSTTADLALVLASPAMQTVVALAERAARTDIPVLISGESGTGKEVLARHIWSKSARRAEPFVAVNCGAIPDDLVESVLFGHEKGAFTGATEKHLGKFEEADGGTLFLDEIGDLPLDAQVKLLRAVQSGEIDAVGARRARKVDVRIITASHRDLPAMVETGAFREDLYYRLDIFPILIPPLKDRGEDIVPLARHFAEKYATASGRARPPEFQPQALALLERFDWPGNVRQLENGVFRAMVLAEGDCLTVDDFGHIAKQLQTTGAEQGRAFLDAVPDLAPDLVPSAIAPLPTPGMIPLLFEDGRLVPLADLEAEIIRHAFAHCDGRMSRVARELGIGRSTLYRKAAELGLDQESS